MSESKVKRIVKGAKKDYEYEFDKDTVKQYNTTYYEKKATERIKCQTCYCEYSIFNKWNHNKSKVHMNAVRIREYIKLEGIQGQTSENVAELVA